MGLPVKSKRMLDDTQSSQEHYGKIAQKLLALTFRRMGFHIMEERSVEGVDIDVVHKNLSLKYALEVKTAQGRTARLEAKDVEGLQRRREDGYETFYAVLCQPFCITDGWIIFPADAVSPGERLPALRFCRNAQKELCREVNAVFPEVLEEAYPHLMAGGRGDRLRVIRDRFQV